MFYSGAVVRGSLLINQERLRKLLLILGLTALGFVVMGYHPGLEDDGIYLSAVKAHLNPALFPFHPEFFRLQLEATLFDGWMASFVRLTGASVEWAELLWQLVSIFLVLCASYRLARRLFSSVAAQWAAVATVSAMFTLPVAGTALFLMDQHLHPRNLATALTLLAVAEVLAARRWSAALLLGMGFLLHPIMAAMGISFCVFLSLALMKPVPQWVAGLVPARRGSTAALIPLGWILEPANSEWQKALDTRTYYYLYKWHWYEWLGAIAPLLVFWGVWRLAKKQGNDTLSRFAGAVLAYGVFQQALAMAMLAPAAWIRLTPLQPMRYLHLVYFFMVLILGGLIGQHVLERKTWRWAAFLLLANGGMLMAQRAEFSASQHLEWPGRAPENPWLQAFAWIRANTPPDAYFALDPHYLEVPGEDFHGFRALAERSQLADAVKDAATVTQVPELSIEWDREVTAGEGWTRFGPADFRRLKHDFGVNWVVVALSQVAGLDCRWHNELLAVCAIP
jgi:hypothetical protein